MAKNTRINQIKELLHEKGKVDAAELCDLFDVSSVTILLIFTIDFGFNLAVRMKKMESIAHVAADYIKDDTWIYLSSGLTGHEVAKKLLDRKLNVVTGGVDTAITLSEGNQLQIFIPGGNVVRAANGRLLSGDWYIRALSEMRFDQSYISISGIDFTTGYSVNNSIELLHMEKIKEVSRETIIMADSTKFDYQAFMSVADLDYADTIITNNDLPDAYRDYFNAHGIKLLTD